MNNDKDCPTCDGVMSWKGLLKSRCFKCDPAVPIKWPEIGMSYRYKNGATYKVIMFSNMNSVRLKTYPITVIYMNETNGTIWSRPADDWFRSFEELV